MNLTSTVNPEIPVTIPLNIPSSTSVVPAPTPVFEITVFAGTACVIP